MRKHSPINRAIVEGSANGRREERVEDDSRGSPELRALRHRRLD